MFEALARSALRRTTMVERICPACQQANPIDDRFCGKCGAPLERQLPVRLADTRLTIAGRNLPITWQQLGKTVALSAAALAADVGLAWLRRRIEAGPATTSTSLARHIPATPPAATPGNATGSIVTIISQRVIEIWDSGDGKRQINERHVWRRMEE
jgi:Double zinc ribbon